MFLIEARDAVALCNATAVLDGEGIRSILRLASHPVNAPVAELLELLEKLVLRCVSNVLYVQCFPGRQDQSAHGCTRRIVVLCRGCYRVVISRFHFSL